MLLIHQFLKIKIKIKDKLKISYLQVNLLSQKIYLLRYKMPAPPKESHPFLKSEKWPAIIR